MKHIFILLSLLFSVAYPLKADLILLRDGSEIASEVLQISDDRVVYRINKNDISRYVDTQHVYMIKFDRRGNVYITPDRKRITGEDHSIPKDVDLVYLVNGAEFIAYDLRIGVDKVSFLPAKPSKKTIPVAMVYDLKDVFKVKYADGTIDVITNLIAPPPSPIVETAPETAEEIQPEFQVIFHTVAKKETLNSIGERYGVTPEEIISWNELSKATKHNAYLAAGTQLMLYVKSITK